MDRFGMRTLLLAAGVVVLSVSLAVALAASRPTTYAAVQEILHDYGDLDASASDRRQQTQLALAQSRAVLLPIAEEHDLTVEELSDHLELEFAGEVLQLRAEHTDPDVALDLASAVGSSYLALISQRATEDTDGEDTEAVIADRLAALEERRDEIRETLDELEAERVAREEEDLPPASAAEEQRLQSEYQEIVRRIGDLESLQLQQELDETEVEEEPPAQTLGEPYVLDEPVGPRPLRAGLIGLVIGLVLAVAVVTLRSSIRPHQAPPDGEPSSSA